MRRYSPSHIRGYKLKPSPHTIAVQSRPKLHSPIPLPIELLFEIFLFAVSTLDVLDLRVGEGISMLPMTLGHVSRIWRQAATLSPVLWSFFRIHTGALDRHFIPKLEICLERSETCLLDLVVTTGDSELGDTPRITTYLFDRLAFYSQRWVSISVDFDGYRYSHPQCLESLQKPLKLLHLRTVRLYYVSYLPPCFKAALNVGTLDIRLSWSQAAAPFLPPLPAGFQALETLSVVGAGVTSLDAVAFLYSHHLISFLTLEMIAAEHEHYLRWPKTLTLPNLVSLELKQSCYILHVFECPKLHTLCLSNNDISGDYPETAILDRELAAFLARTPSLQTFRHHPPSRTPRPRASTTKCHSGSCPHACAALTSSPIMSEIYIAFVYINELVYFQFRDSGGVLAAPSKPGSAIDSSHIYFPRDRANPTFHCSFISTRILYKIGNGVVSTMAKD